MSQSFADRLFPVLPAVIREFGTPFHIYDEAGIRETCRHLNQTLGCVGGFKEYYAVKALPNPAILRIMRDYRFGFDCSSTMELELCQSIGARDNDVMFTSNNTTVDEFKQAMSLGAIVNLDDVSLVDKVPEPFPELICFRYNPGKLRGGNSIIGAPHEAKYGIMTSQVVSAYRAARERGAKRFGIHTMICSNQRNYRYMVQTVEMLLRICITLEKELGIRAEFINMGGGIGIPYHPRQRPVDLKRMAAEIRDCLCIFGSNRGWQPKLFMESGRYMTGPHGVLVSQVINRKEIYQTHIGVDTGMTGNMCHAMYGAYHHITVLDANGRPANGRRKEVVNIVGPICENCDRLATQRRLPRTKEGDLIVMEDNGAHCIAMGFNYNGRLRPQELLFRSDGVVVRIRRAETNEDLWRTLYCDQRSEIPIKRE